MVDRKHRDFSDEDIAKLSDTFTAFQEGRLEEVKGFCAVADIEEIAKQDYILTPGRYVGIEEQEEEVEAFEEGLLRSFRRCLRGRMSWNVKLGRSWGLSGMIFETVKIGQICQINQYTYSLKDNWKFVNITQNKVDKIQYIDLSTEKLPSRAKRKVIHNSIIFSTVRPNQLHYGIIKTQPDIFLVSTGFSVIDVDEKRANADFVFYSLTQFDIIQHLQAIAEQSTSAYPSIKPSDIEDLDIKLPDKYTQNKIAALLLSIDNKIALNTAINENLEQQAQVVFETMFPDVLNSNGNNTLEEIISFSNGKKRPEEKGNIPVFGGNGILAYTNKSNSFNCVVIGRVGAYCGNVSLCLEDCWISDNAISAKSKISESQIFIFYLLKHADLPNRHIGTGQPLITQSILNSVPCIIPETKRIKEFENICQPIYDMIFDNMKENENLVALRNTLLPKLMNGEIDVSNIKI